MRTGSNLYLYALAARAFASARWRARRLRDRAAIQRHHKHQIEALTRHAARHFAYYTTYAAQPFENWPVIDKSILVENFQSMNLAGLSAPEVRDLLASQQERSGRFVIGQSTGTSGNRGYYLISDAERFVWLGTILAKTLPDALWRRHKVALALPGLSSLYRSAGTVSRIQLGFFDLAQGVDAWADDLHQFGADTLVAPPKVLRLLAERGQLSAQTIFSGAEVLDPLDRAVIEGTTGRKVREIYMATEGLFGVSCEHGTLHLAEDVVHFEWESPAVGSALQAPIVTDFTRRSQALIRYRINDLMELAPQECACGSPFQAIRQISGRADDILMLAGPDGRLVPVTPDVLRNAVVDADPRVLDFRIAQTGPSALEIRLDQQLPAELDDQVRQSVLRRLAALDLGPEITLRRGLDVPFDHKLRRVRRLAF